MTPAFPPDFALVTPRLTLRPPREADLDAIVAGIGDFAVSRMLARVPHPYSRADAEEWLALMRAEAGGLALTIHADGAVVGGIGIHPRRRGAVLGYWLARPAWGRGLATEAGDAVVAFGFGPLGLEAIHSGVIADNAASFNVQRKLGFVETGRSELFCLARSERVTHIDTVLTAARYADRLAEAAGAGISSGSR